MISEKKISLDRKDELKTALDLINQTSAVKLIFIIPKDSILGRKPNNFQILKKESNNLQKELIVESIDEHILELAGLAGLEAINPVFKTRERVVADIIPVISNRKEETKKEIKKEILAEPQQEEPLTVEQPRKIERAHLKRGRKPIRAGRLFVFAVILIALGFGLFKAATVILPKATILITLKKVPVEFKETVYVSSATTAPNSASGTIALPGELLVATKNLEMRFPANGKEQVETKARGTLTVFNAYSSSPQTLVQSTRFQSPDNKIFRLDKQVVIPAAKIVDGKIVASKIDVAVTADEAGEAYNIQPSTNWRIPGFKGGPKYDGFYAEAINAMTGGFKGEKAMPTEKELEEAKTTVRRALEDALKSQMLILLKDKFKLMPEATTFSVTKEEILTETNEPGKFSIFAEAELKHLVFEEETLKKVIIEKTKPGDDSKIKNFNLIYGTPQLNLNASSVSVAVNGSIIFVSDIKEKDLTAQLLGKDEQALKSIVFTLPGLEKANISLWPFWVKKVPAKPSKVMVIVD